MCVCVSHRADLLPLSVQLSLLIGLFEATGLSALGHLDAVLEGRPAETKVSVDRALLMDSEPRAAYILGQSLFVVHVV